VSALRLPAAQAPAAAHVPEVRAFFRAYVEAWNRHDAREMAAFWTPTGDLLNTRGHLASGREAVEAMLRQEHAGPLGRSRARMTLTHVRGLRTCLHADLDQTLEGVRGPDGRERPPLRLHVSCVLRHVRGEGWRYVLVRPYAFLTSF
jgi:uncharacterized protein (TIGR02246 family)